MYGFHNRVLRINLNLRSFEEEFIDDEIKAKLLGGKGLATHLLLNNTKAGVDPFSEDNVIIFATGPVTGVPVSGAGRNNVAAKSPLIDGYGSADVGGYWGAELKHAGYDAIIVEGKAASPVYIWINDVVLTSLHPGSC